MRLRSFVRIDEVERMGTPLNEDDLYNLVEKGRGADNKLPAVEHYRHAVQVGRQCGEQRLGLISRTGLSGSAYPRVHTSSIARLNDKGWTRRRSSPAGCNRFGPDCRDEFVPAGPYQPGIAAPKDNPSVGR